jgi:hypothetical protein
MVVANDHGALVVLHGPRDDLGGRGCYARRQDHERTIIDNVLVVVFENLDLGEDVLDGNDATVSDEKPGDLDGTLEFTSSVAGKVEEQAVRLRLMDLAE